MSCSLPPEILDLIAEHLRDEPATLKTCCVIDKSWVPRTRRHLFAHVEFRGLDLHVERWKKTFPNPSNSPAHYTRSLAIVGFPVVTAADTDAGGWIHTFHNVIHLRFECLRWEDHPTSLVPFYGLSPTVRSLRITSIFSGVFDFVCSFPFLEDLALVFYGPERGVDGWNAPSTSPKLTGSLDLRMAMRGTHSTIRRLLDLPNGLHFTKVTMSCLSGDFESATDLVSACSGTLESLTVVNWVVDAGTSETPLIDLSKATKLKDMEFRGRDSTSIRWITVALQTVKSKNLRQITIHSPLTIPDPAGEVARREWQDLDHLLVQFWTSNSIRSQVMYEPEEGRKDITDHASSLLPELTRRGLVDLVEFPPR